jgi:hypothetical protein
MVLQSGRLRTYPQTFPWLEKLARSIYSSLFRTLVNHSSNLFIKLAPLYSSLFYAPVKNEVKMFYNINTRAYRYKLFTAVIYKCSAIQPGKPEEPDEPDKPSKPGKPFQFSVMFASKAVAYPSQAPFRCSILALHTNIRQD